MGEVIQHVQEHWMAYALGAAILLPALVFSRKYLIAYLWWPGEYLAYVGGFHLVLLGIMHGAAWFKQNTRMYWEERTRPDWTMPLYRVWEYELYNPRWILYLEISVAVIILYFMYQYRPMVVQRLRPRREQLVKGRAAQVRPPGSPPASTRSRY